MHLYQQLQRDTVADRNYLLAAPAIQRALAGEAEYQDFYYVRPGIEGRPPNNWVSKFGGPAWAPFGNTGDYFLHLYDVTQADLNWHNPRVREEMAKVVEFWRDAGYQKWFARDAAFDAQFRRRFEAAHFAAACGEYEAWMASAEGALALQILLDQFPRNSFRGTGHMYATDPLARHFARQAIAAGHDREIDEKARLFFSLPFSHSESLADPEFAVACNSSVGGDGLKHAIGHRDIIKKFGRFPHRNRILGRETTPEEQAFLDEGGFAG